MDDHRLWKAGKRFDALLRACVPIIWWADASGAISEPQPEWQTYTGQDWSGARDAGWLSAFHPDDRDGVEATCRRAIAAGEPLLARGRLWNAARRAYGAVQMRMIPVRGADGRVVEWQGAVIETGEPLAAPDADAAAAHEVLRRSEERARRLLREVNHRSKNLLSVVMTIARQTSQGDRGDFVERFDARIRSLAIDQDLQMRNEWMGFDLDSLLDAHLRPFAEAREGRVARRGPALHLASAMAAQSLGMAIHELATNACAYGALSVATGRVDVAWDVETASEGRPLLSMTWRERGGPAVPPPQRKGFGTLVLTTMLQYSLGAEATLAYRPDGLEWRLRCPLARLTQGPRREEETASP